MRLRCTLLTRNHERWLEGWRWQRNHFDSRIDSWLSRTVNCQSPTTNQFRLSLNEIQWEQSKKYKIKILTNTKYKKRLRACKLPITNNQPIPPLTQSPQFVQQVPSSIHIQCITVYYTLHSNLNKYQNQRRYSYSLEKKE